MSGEGEPQASKVNDRAQWDQRLQSVSGHLLQSWRWGDFKSRHGWSVERIGLEVGPAVAQAQLLIRRKGPFGLGYVPRGPAFSDAIDAKTASALFDAIDAVAGPQRLVNAIVEPDRRLPLSGSFRSHGFVTGPEHFQPSRTVKIPLLPDEELLAQMHQKTRYSVRLSERRGVRIERGGNDPNAFKAFYGLLLDTSDRNQFGIHPERYYSDFLTTFADDAILLLAYVDQQLAAGLIAARFGSEAIYMYGASSTRHRAHGAAFGLQFEAMRWARGLGCERYDLWGIPHEDPVSTQSEPDRVAGTKGDDWRGLYKFKIGFGGTVVTYPPTLERRYRPLLSLIARRRYGSARSD